LDEIKGLYPETKQRLMSMLSVDAKAIHTLSVNKLPLEAFRKHPYISFWQAKVLVELRKARGRIESIEDLSAFKEFKKEDLERLKWYLSFQ
jgi:DNA uptake protein ComE-like DNA-binding protein